MSDATLLAGALLAVASGVTYAYVGFHLSTRPGPREQLALRAFGLWWIGLAFLTLISAVQNGLWLFGVREPEAFIAIAFLTLGPLCVAVGALFYYLAYLFSGRRGLIWVSAAYYAILYVGLVFVLALSNPAAAEAMTWHVQVASAATPPPFLALAVIVLLVLPVLGGVVGYGSLVFRVREPIQRYRIVVISLSLLLWFGGTLGAQLAGVAESDAWGIASRLMGLGAALAVLLAYRPPAGVQRRLVAASVNGGARDG